MVWIYETPLTPQERLVQKTILRSPQYSRDILKILNLIVFLKKHKFRNATHLRNSIFVDARKKHHFFTLSQAREIYDKKGGGEYPVFQNLIEGTGSFLKNNDPTPISWFVMSALGIVSMPAQFVKREVGEGPYELASGLIHGLLETGVSGVNGVAADAAGPVGLAAVGLFTGAAAAVGSILATAEGDHAQAAVHAINFVPGIGPAIVKGINKGEHLASKVNEHRDQISSIPLIGETVLSIVPTLDEKTPTEIVPTGGKRLSTIKRKEHKWRKTLRRR